jgi:outer membrane protein OmpA-like peptidoglycan-associated protein
LWYSASTGAVEVIPMMRWAGIALLALLVSACAAKPDVRPTAAPVSAGPDLNNRELMETLAREGVGTIVTEESERRQQGGEKLDTEIRETPRGVVVTFRHILFVFDSAQLGPVARREVERFALVLNDPRVRRRTVSLEGHADALGSRTVSAGTASPWKPTESAGPWPRTSIPTERTIQPAVPAIAGWKPSSRIDPRHRHGRGP